MTDIAFASQKRAHPDTSTIFVLGLLSVMGFGLFGIAAWFFGNRLLAKYDAQPDRWGRRGWVEAGRLMGIIGIPLSVVLWVAAAALG